MPKESFVITINRKRSPQISYIHLPSMSFVEFISDIGGAMGLWFGFSILASITNIFPFFKLFFRGRKTTIQTEDKMFVKPSGKRHK